MAARKPGSPDVASVDYLVDENASPIDVPDGSMLKVATEVEQTVGATGPTNWWRMGLIALGLVALLLLALQLLGGGAGTDMVPGTPVVAPQQSAPQN